MKRKKIIGGVTAYILLAMLLGILTGYCFRRIVDNPAHVEAFSNTATLISEIFLRLLKMIMAPLVLTTLISGIASQGSAKVAGRVGGKAMIWFMGASLLSLVVGLVMVNILKPGVDLALPLPEVSAEIGVVKTSVNFRDFLLHAVPSSIADAMAQNQILAIVVFSVFFGSAAAAIGAPAKPLIDLIDVVAKVMLKITAYVMCLAPVAVFAAIASVIAKQDLGVLYSYLKLIGEFYLTISFLWALLILAGFFVLGPRIWELVKSVEAPMMIAFSTATSESVYPKLMEQLEKFGCPRKISSFVLPMGYSFNMDGSTMYCTFATMFIAQAYGIEVSIGNQILMVLMLMLTSKGIAGVPRVSFVIIAANLVQFGIPEAGLLLLFGIDYFLDMGRSATNVLGNVIASSVVAKWEGALQDSNDAAKT